MRPIRESLVVSLLLAPAAGEVAGQEPERTLQIAGAARPPELDDFVRGDSARPGEAVVSDFRQRDPGDGNPAGAPTMAYLSYDDANLYVMFVCRDRPALVRAGLAKREEIASDDGVALYLDTFGDRYPRRGVRVSPARGTECVAYGYPAHAGGVAVAHHVGRMLRCAECVRAECRRVATPRLATPGAAR